MKILPVIMSGGSGTRLWPASTEERPKQFHSLASDATMLQETAARVCSEEYLNPLVICNVRHGALVADQLTKLGLRAAGVVMEPFGRNTAAVGVMAALWAELHAPKALVLLMPADHLIADAAGFRAKVAFASETAKSKIVTFGIDPTGPATGYGYIQSGVALEDGIFEVNRFVEKPDRDTAQGYLDEGGYSWNAGIFLYAPEILLAEARRLCPAVVASAGAALETATATLYGLVLDDDAFADCPAESIDIAIMEKTELAAVVPISVGWSDIGSWSELWHQRATADLSNVSKGDGVVLDGTGSLLWSDGPSISVIGLSDIIVVASQGHVLVLPKDRAQDVKHLVEIRKAKQC